MKPGSGLSLSPGACRSVSREANMDERVQWPREPEPPCRVPPAPGTVLKSEGTCCAPTGDACGPGRGPRAEGASVLPTGAPRSPSAAVSPLVELKAEEIRLLKREKRTRKEKNKEKTTAWPAARTEARDGVTADRPRPTGLPHWASDGWAGPTDRQVLHISSLVCWFHTRYRHSHSWKT